MMFEFKHLLNNGKYTSKPARDFFFRRKLLPKHNFLIINPNDIPGLVGILIKIPEQTDLDFVNILYKYRKALPRTEKNIKIIQKALQETAYIIRETDVNSAYNKTIEDTISSMIKYYFNINNKPLISADRKFSCSMLTNVPIAGVCKSTVPFYNMTDDEYHLYMLMNGLERLNVDKYLKNKD